MKQKHLFLVMSVILSLLSVSTKTMAKVTEVGTAQQFIDAFNANDSIKLIADIDLSCFKNTVDNYTGEISGQKANPSSNEMAYYTISNLKEMLAWEMNKAYIHHVNFNECKPDWNTNAKYKGTATICRDANNCTFEEIFFVNSVTEGHNNWNPLYYDDAACMVSVAKSCKFTGIVFLGCKAYADDTYVGLVAGEAYSCTLTDLCNNYECAVYAGGGGSDSYGGGFIGYAESTSCTRCYNLATVNGKYDRLGGIIGGGKNCTFTECKNSGVVCHSENSGGASAIGATAAAATTAVVGGMASWVSKSKILYDVALSTLPYDFSRAGYTAISKSAQGVWTVRWAGKGVSAAGATVTVVLIALEVAYIVYDFQEPDEVGGIVGYLGGGNINKCENFGYCVCRDAYCGGIVGYAEKGDYDLVIKNCLNTGMVQGDEQTGGIVGYIKNGTIRACLNTGSVGAAASTVGRIDGERDDISADTNLFAGNNTIKYDGGSMMITQKQLVDGEAAQMLNKAAGENIWRQTVGTDMFPSFSDESSATITVNENADSTYYVSDGIGLLSAITNQYAIIKLTKDIVLNTSMFCLSSKQMPFHGIIDGQGHRISGITYGIIPFHNDWTNFAATREYVALLPYAENATFKNLEISNFNVIRGGAPAEYVASLVGHSYKCTYENISITESKLEFPEQSFWGSQSTIYKIGGLVARSDNDIFKDCWTGPTCKFYTYGSMSHSLPTATGTVGGLAAEAFSSTFKRCYNAASVKAEDDEVGGLLANAYSCTLDSCLNMGFVEGKEKVGGFIGYLQDTNISNSFNTGTVHAFSNDETVGGLVGQGKKESVDCGVRNCYNFGSLNNSDSENNYGVIFGKNESVVTENFYNVQVNGVTRSNIDDATMAKVKSGQFAYENKLYQSIDNHVFTTSYPMPIPKAGEVFKNILCDGTEGYSNKYHSEASHEPQVNNLGVCTICGKVSNVPDEINISTADELCMLAEMVNYGESFANKQINLSNDIDLKGYAWTPIGTGDHPFEGTFNGKGYRIKNMIVSTTQEGAGFFGVVDSPKDTYTQISGVVIDSTCTVTGSYRGVAGLIGYVKGESIVRIFDCGNEANVIGCVNAAGILGGVYYSDNADVTIQRCYNYGEIDGAKESAAISGWMNKNFTVTYCWNTGLIKGIELSHPFVRFADGGKATINNCYTTADLQTGVEKLDSLDLAYGRFAWKLNVVFSHAGDPVDFDDPDASLFDNYKIVQQSLGKDKRPVISYMNGNGVYYKFKVPQYRWGTLILPFAVTSNSDVKFYTVENFKSADIQSTSVTNTDDIAFTENSIPANTPCFYQVLNASLDSVCIKANGEVARIDTTSFAAVAENERWLIVGSYGPRYVNDCYVLDSTDVKWAYEPEKIEDFSAYIKPDKDKFSDNKKNFRLHRHTRNGWGTMVVPFAVKADEHVYYAEMKNVDKDNNLYLELRNDVPANTPCFYFDKDYYDSLEGLSMAKANKASAYTETVIQAVDDIYVEPTVANPVFTTITEEGDTLNLIGTYLNMTVKSIDMSNDSVASNIKDNYYLHQDNNLMRIDEDYELPAFSAYVQLNSNEDNTGNVNGEHIYSFTADSDNPTGIHSVNVSSHNFSTEAIYDLQGRRVSKPGKGQIYIIGGKKILEK